MITTTPTIDECETEIFRLVESRLRRGETSFAFGAEPGACRHLQTLLHLAATQFSTEPLAAVAYLFTTIIGQRPFSRGNEALAVALTIDVLLRSGLTIHEPPPETVREQLKWLFPRLQWEERGDLVQGYELLFYYLARVLADPAQKGALTLAQEQAAVRHLLPLVASA